MSAIYTHCIIIIIVRDLPTDTPPDDCEVLTDEDLVSFFFLPSARHKYMKYELQRVDIKKKMKIKINVMMKKKKKIEIHTNGRDCLALAGD